MTNWKQRGFVPDSDDDDDVIESKEKATSEGQDCPLQDIKFCKFGATNERDPNARSETSEILEKDLNSENDNVSFLPGYYTPISSSSLPRMRDLDTGANAPTPTLQSEPDELKLELAAPETTVDTPNISSPPVVENDRHSKTPIENKCQYSTLLSSPSYPKVFKIPKPFWEESAGHEHLTEASGANDDLPIHDDISKSYIQISSPASSILSSPPSSLPDIFGPQRSRSPVLEIAWKRNSVDQDLNNSSKNTLPEHGIYQDSDYPMKRALRQRNLIQLHPYIVEQEKYRQTLKARGIAPLRIVHSRDYRGNMSHNSNSQGDDDTRGEDSQDFIVPSTKQANKNDKNLVLSPCSVETIGLSNDLSNTNDYHITTNSNSENGEDFPDLNKLIEERYCFSPIANTMRKIKNSPVNSKCSSHDGENLPVSPAQVSPSNQGFVAQIISTPENLPTLRTKRYSTPQLPSISSISSLEHTPTPSLLIDENSALDPMTQPTSDLRPSEETMNQSNLILNTKDPFTSDSDKMSLENSSSDESLQLRRVSKKIRGVLPASHLRLDLHKKSQHMPRMSQDLINLSPVRNLPRKGIAIPKARKITSEKSLMSSSGLQFLSDEEEEEETDHTITKNNYTLISTEKSPEFDRACIAEEDNSIDKMLPSRKRQISYNSQHTHTKKKILGAGLQSRITNHLKRPLEEDIQSSRFNKRLKYKIFNNPPKLIQPRTCIPPKLSILDVVDLSCEGYCKIPDFIKIATRTARSRQGQGRHFPFKKYIRLATLEDTQEVLSVLADWKGGHIISKAGLKKSVPITKSTTNQSCQTYNSKNPNPSSSVRISKKLDTGSSKSSVKQRNIQKSIEYYVSNKQLMQLDDVKHLHQRPRYSEPKKKKILKTGHTIRPAQLESSITNLYLGNSSAAFKLSKRKLDAIYASSLRKSNPRSNIQLSLFLEDKEPLSLAETSLNIQESEPIDKSSSAHLKKNLKKKRPPKRLDAGAARYRQPSDPLILESITKGGEGSSNNCSKLLGLRKFGTKYPINFDILPLQQGTFFQDSTFIGSGRLRKILQGMSYDQQNFSKESFSLQIGERKFSWVTWDETSASEIGVCFDLLLDYLTDSELTSSSFIKPKEIIIFVLDFVQENILFDELLNQNSFITRMLQVLQEFSSRLDLNLGSEMVHLCQITDVLTICSALVFHLLQNARTHHEMFSVTLDLEIMLKKMTSQCVSVLLLQGLDNLRKLYDDMQYLSFRKVGINNKQHTVEGWVIIIRILEAAHIPRGSFWDVVNHQLKVNEICNGFDAVSMEQLWYSMYSLLPLCEFDDLGRVISGQRQVASFDNWYIPQHMLKKVLALYISNPRQSSGFNEYCRALLSRCHYLMVEWGWWKSSGLIGSIFDFFASQNLRHLRNEEVYHSPRFLEKLDTEPSLALEPEDCCFHIFLKIIALEIKHLGQIHDTKTIRNLAPRLLPNHDRKYPKEEDLHQQDLASLRNHHDLLCTLFWSMPSENRPSISLIQELVVADRSHKEACLINLQSWENLTRFLVTNISDPQLYQPFKSWQFDFFNSVHEQYIGAEVEVRQQADEIFKKSGNSMTETRVNEIVVANRRNIIATMIRSINAMGNIIKSVRCDSIMKQALNSDVLTKALDPFLYNEDQLSNSLLKEVIQVFVYSMDQVEKLYQSGSNEHMSTHFEYDDSQDSIDMINWSRMEVICQLESLLDFLRPVIRKKMGTSLIGQPDNIIDIQLVDCLGRLVAIVTENESMKFQSNFLVDKNTVFEKRRFCSLAHHYWPLFIAKLLYHGKSLDDFKFSGFDIGLEWLLSMIEIEATSMPKAVLTFQLNQKGYFLCSMPNLYKLDRSQIIKCVICKMSEILFENLTITEMGLTHKQAQRYFSEMLGEVLKSMQQSLESLDPNSEDHTKYLVFVRGVIKNIKCYASDFRNLTDFFIHPSSHYWPNVADPNLYAAGIVSYCVRLGPQPEKTSFELFYYLHSGWTNSLVNNRLKEYKCYIEKGMKRKEFTKFIMAEFIPAILEVGFFVDGWLLCSTFLPTVRYRVARVLELMRPDSTWMFESFMNILGIILNGIKSIGQQFQNDIRGVNPEHRGILAVVVQFWMENAPAMRQYIGRNPDKAETLYKVLDPLNTFIYHCLKNFENGQVSIVNFSREISVTKGKYRDKFVAFLTREIRECWQFSDDSHFQVTVRARSKEISAQQLFENTLEEVLRGEIAIYESLFESQEGIELMKEPNLLIQQIIL